MRAMRDATTSCDAMDGIERVCSAVLLREDGSQVWWFVWVWVKDEEEEPQIARLRFGCSVKGGFASEVWPCCVFRRATKTQAGR